MQKNDGIYQDEKGELWVAIHLEDEDLLEWGEDLSNDFGFPQYTIISSGNCDFLDMDQINAMIKLNDVKYQCVRFDYDCYDYIYIDEEKFRNHIMNEFKKIHDYNCLEKFVKKYSGIICAVEG